MTKAINKYHRLFPYNGSKYRSLDILLPMIMKNKKSHNSTYVEPFIGSGALFLNVSDIFDKYIINDMNFDVYNIYKSLSQAKYSEIWNYINDVFYRYPEIYISTDVWADYTEEVRLLEAKSHYEYGIGMFFLLNSTFHGDVRKNKSGRINQPSKFKRTKDSIKEFSILNELTFNILKRKLAKTEILNVDCINTDTISFDNSVVFLDPPYLDAEITYNTMFGYTIKSLLTLMHKMIQSKNTMILYTDVESQTSDFLLQHGFDKKITRKMINTTAQVKEIKDKHSIDKNEVVYFKYE